MKKNTTVKASKNVVKAPKNVVTVNDTQFDFLTENKALLNLSAREISKLDDKQLYKLLVKLDKLLVNEAYLKNDNFNANIEAQKIEAEKLAQKLFAQCNTNFHEYKVSHKQYIEPIQNYDSSLNALFYAKIIDMLTNSFDIDQVQKMIFDHGHQTEIRSGFKSVAEVKVYFKAEKNNIVKIYNLIVSLATNEKTETVKTETVKKVNTENAEKLLAETIAS